MIELISQPPPSGGVAPEKDHRPECFHYRPGTYRHLRHGSTTFMTDLYDEWYTQRSAVREAWMRGGAVLVTGLGLGLVVEAMLDAPDSPVTKVTVIEQSEDVIRLVAPYLNERWGSRVEVVHGDAFTWTPPHSQTFSVGWHDIWPDPHGQPVRESVRRLEAHHQGHCAWQGSWPTEYQRAAAS